MTRVFQAKKGRGRAKIFLIAIVIIAVIIGIWYFVSLIEHSRDTKSIGMAKDQVMRATVQCYALEGRYPPSMDYLQKNYGLILDEENFVYYYRSIGENMMPEIRVFPLKD